MSRSTRQAGRRWAAAALAVGCASFVPAAPAGALVDDEVCGACVALGVEELDAARGGISLLDPLGKQIQIFFGITRSVVVDGVEFLSTLNVALPNGGTAPLDQLRGSGSAAVAEASALVVQSGGNNSISPGVTQQLSPASILIQNNLDGIPIQVKTILDIAVYGVPLSSPAHAALEGLQHMQRQ